MNDVGLVTLVSGGLDSTLMSCLAKEAGVQQFPLFVDYGQLSSEREWQSCLLAHRALGLPKPRRMNLSGFGRLVSSGLTDPTRDVNEDAFLPGRNLLFILAGAAYAYHVGARAVAIGLLRDDHRLFPDQSIEFIRISEKTLEVAFGMKIEVITPLAEMSKADVIALARARGIRGTYSCHSGTAEPCGVCVSCLEIRNANMSIGEVE